MEISTVERNGEKISTSKSCIHRDEVEYEDDLTCGVQIGCGSYTTKRVLCTSLQRFATPRWALAFIGTCAFLQGFIINGHTNAILSTLERRFDLTSTQTGLLASCYDIMSCIVILAVTYFGTHGHKPQYIGWGAIVIGLGGLLFALPQFIAPEKNFQPGTGIFENKCGLQTLHECNSTLKNYRYVFYVAFLMIGFGATPLYSLGITYFDENVKQRYSSMYSGILYSMAIFGPGVGYLLASVLLKIPANVDQWFKEKTMKETNENWIGAWWVGYIITGVLALLISIPILFLPKELPNGRRHRSERSQEMHDDPQALAVAKDVDFGKTIKDAPKSLLILLRNPTFVCLTISFAMDSLIINGFATFGPKYMQSVFGLKASSAGLYFGAIAIAGGVLGQLSGGSCVSKFNLSIRWMLHLSYAAPILALFAIGCFRVTCDDSPFAGVNRNYFDQTTTNLISDCNKDCGCTKSLYVPICGSDQRTYYSPCYAGCTNSTGSLFESCECISNSSGSTNATVGACLGSECQSGMFLLFCILFFFLIFFTFFNHAPTLQISLRSVAFNQRSLSIGFQWCFVRLFGTIPGPLIIGAVFDNACEQWSEECGETGSCLVYSSKRLSLLAFIFCIAAKGANLIFTFAAMLCYKPMNVNKYQQEEQGGEVEGSAKKEVDDFEMLSVSSSNEASTPNTSDNTSLTDSNPRNQIVYLEEHLNKAYE